MKRSATKQNIDPLAIKAFAESSFKKSVSTVREIEDGFYNTAFEITLSGGDKTLLKIAPPPGVRVLRDEKGLMDTEISAMRAVSGLDIPVPKIFLACSADDTPFGAQCFFMEYIEGTTFDKLMSTASEKQISRIFTQLGQIAARIHGITSPGFGFVHSPVMTWSTAFTDLIKNLLDDARDIGADIGIEPDRIFRTVIKYRDALDEVREASLLHKDMWFGNLIIGKSGDSITGIIDWERSLYGDPIMELVFAFIEGLFSYKGGAAYYKGYGRSPSLTESEKLRVTLYTLYYVLLLLVEGYFRDYRDLEREPQMRGLLAKLIDELDRL